MTMTPLSNGRAAGPARVVVIGAVHEALPVLEAVIGSDLVTLAGVLTLTRRGTRSVSGAVDLQSAAVRAGAEVLRDDDPNSARALAWVGMLEPDLLVVVGWSQLIGSTLLAMARCGCVGFHASLLPRDRGHAPVNWAILRGESRTGNTMMLLDRHADTGDIVAQTVIPIGPDDTCATVYAEVGRSGARMLLEHLPALLDGSVRRTPQTCDGGEMLPRRVPDMGITDWTRSRREVHDWVRALTKPYPGAFTLLGGRRVMVWETRLESEPGPWGGPGEILRADRDGIQVGVGDGSILVTRVSEVGRSPRHARRWLFQARVPVGAVFEPVAPDIAQWATTAVRQHAEATR